MGDHSNTNQCSNLDCLWITGFIHHSHFSALKNNIQLQVILCWIRATGTSSNDHNREVGGCLATATIVSCPEGLGTDYCNHSLMPRGSGNRLQQP